MRFLEVAGQPLKIVATKRFLKNAPDFLRGYPGLDKTLKEFVDFKAMNPLADWGRKDAVFTGGQQVGHLRHVHLVHGKVIVLYEIVGGELRLYDMVSHKGIDKQEMGRFGDYHRHLGDGDFAGYAPAVKQKLKLNPELFPPEDDWELEARVVLPEEQMQELEALFYEMAVQDRDIIEAALHGNFADIMEFMTMVAPEDPTTLLNVYGGAEGFQQHLRDILKQVG